MIYPFLELLPQIRSHIYKDVLTPDFFNLVQTCRVIRKEGLIELKGRIQRLGVQCEEGWGVLECKQAYLWHFGEPEMIFELKIPVFSRPNLSTRGVVYLEKTNNFQGAVEQTFKNWRNDSDSKRMIPIEGLADKVDTADVILIVHRGKDYLLVLGEVWRLMDLTSMNEIIHGKANYCTVDVVSNANYIITYQYHAPGVGCVRWCEISQLIKGEEEWRECIVDQTPHYLQLDVIQNQIIIIEGMIDGSSGRQLRAVDMESGQWVPKTNKQTHELSWDSPIYRIHRQHLATSWVPITMKRVAIGGVPCYQWDLHKQGEWPMLEMRRTVNKVFVPQTIRTLHIFNPHHYEVIAVQSLYNGSWPMLNVVYLVNKMFLCQSWRLALPSHPYAELERLPPSIGYVASDLPNDQWGEDVIVRALRVGAHWAWEPLMHLLGKRLIEDLQNEDSDPDQLWFEFLIACNKALNAAALSNRSQFVEFFFFQWLPPLEKKVREMSILSDIDSNSINMIDELMDRFLTACKLGHVDVALRFIQCSALNTPLSQWQGDLGEWPPLKGVMHATHGFHWDCVISIIAALDCTEQDRVMLYRYIIGHHIKFFGDRISDPDGFARMVVDLCNSEPALLNTSEVIASAAIISNKDLMSQISEEAEIDLPPYNGEFHQWEDIAYRESLIFWAIQNLGSHSEARVSFINWLLSRNLPDRVDEALELMRPEWYKRQRPQSPPL